MLKRLIRRNEKNVAKIFPSADYKLNFDGASKGNPGLSGAGMVIYKNGEEIWSSCKFIGYKTNNQAEYSALILGLDNALKLGIKRLSVLGDSLLVINQLNNIYRVKSEFLFELHKEAVALKSKFEFIEFIHVYRNDNKRADELSNLALENITDLSQIKAEEDDLGIQELHEDWVEDKKANEEICVVKKDRPISNKMKQTKITDLYLKGNLFPEI